MTKHLYDLERPNIYRQKAEECREQAKKAKFPDDQEAWLKLAEDWQQVAMEAERRPGQP